MGDIKDIWRDHLTPWLQDRVFLLEGLAGLILIVLELFQIVSSGSWVARCFLIVGICLLAFAMYIRNKEGGTLAQKDSQILALKNSVNQLTEEKNQLIQSITGLVNTHQTEIEDQLKGVYNYLSLTASDRVTLYRIEESDVVFLGRYSIHIEWRKRVEES